MNGINISFPKKHFQRQGKVPLSFGERLVPIISRGLGVRSTLVLLLLCIFLTISTQAQQATWIWYPGDFEISLSNKMQNRRTDRNTFFPPFWKMDAHYVLMDFHKEFDLKTPEEITVYAEGTYNLKLDGNAFESGINKITVPEGKHKINVKVWNQANVPAIYVQGKTIVSDASWLVTFEDKEWIDETGKTSDISATKWLNAGSWNFNDPLQPPSTFSLPVKPLPALSTVKTNKQWLVDFGKETFGFVKLHGIKGSGKISLYYGESKEEALAIDDAMTLDRLSFSKPVQADSVMVLSKAFRYVNIICEGNISIDSASMLYEYAAVKERGSFVCSDTLINKIYDVAKYTLELNTREFFIDGIKRDRWVWSGDASQSYLMNYYSWFDNPTVTRTMLALRGKDPVTGHINTILDYTFYWFISVYDYYLYTGDKEFIEQLYPRMQTLMEYCLSRRNKNGLVEGLSGDWTFIDWAAGLSKKGEISFEQMLFARSLQTMSLCAAIAKDNNNAVTYNKLAEDLKQKIFSIYWNAQKQALVHSRIDGQPTANITRYANMFGIFFNYFTEEQKQAVKNHVLLNDSIQKITTPYMHFYELEALCAMGEQSYVLKEMKSYWGGMLQLGATSFWEEYDPTKTGAAHLAMYGRKFGKSLCHAWGASPIYLLGKYYLGVTPTKPGYETYSIQPQLGGLQWMQGKVPTPKGDIEIYCSTKQIKVKGAMAGVGTLRLKSKIKPTGKNIVMREIKKDEYEITIQSGLEYVIGYNAM
ncbi:MAG: alpha-L-rhamnosidase [Ferruginibacter sp.]|nr:alpha-L-rhamnosidase [Ferruginibacter sp.]